MLQIKTKVFINKPASEVWQVVHGDFYDVHIWLPEVYYSRKGKPDEPFDRYCETPDGIIRETFINIQTEIYQLSYFVKGFHFTLKTIVATWKVDAVDSKSSILTLTYDIKLLPVFSILAEPILLKKMNKSVPTFLNDLKVFMETGQVSERKLTYQKSYS